MYHRWHTFCRGNKSTGMEAHDPIHYKSIQCRDWRLYMSYFLSETLPTSTWSSVSNLSTHWGIWHNDSVKGVASTWIRRQQNTLSTGLREEWPDSIGYNLNPLAAGKLLRWEKSKAGPCFRKFLWIKTMISFLACNAARYTLNWDVTYLL